MDDGALLCSRCRPCGHGHGRVILEGTGVLDSDALICGSTPGGGQSRPQVAKKTSDGPNS